MHEQPRTFLPAAGRHFALPLYDPLTKLLGADKPRRELIEQASLRDGQRVLDIGSGTGSLVLLAKSLHRGIEIIGFDPDEQALSRSRRKAERAGLSARFERGFADALPYSDGSFDRVFSSFMFHHLSASEKEPTLREVRRVLKPGGSLHLLDFDHPEGGVHGLLQKLFRSPAHGSTQKAPHDSLAQRLRAAGFADVRELRRGRMFLHDIAFYRAGV